MARVLEGVPAVWQGAVLVADLGRVGSGPGSGFINFPSRPNGQSEGRSGHFRATDWHAICGLDFGRGGHKAQAGQSNDLDAPHLVWDFVNVLQILC